GKFLSWETERDFLEKRFGPGGHGNPVEQLLGIQTPRQRVREIRVVVGVPLVGVEAQLIRSRIDDRADQMPQIVLVLDEILGQRIEKLRADWRITCTDMVGAFGAP